jgi:glycosyltransferase involved in cell wall biosynthesis
MRIAVDARELAGRPTGVGRYLWQLLHAWSESSDARRHEWHLFAPQAVMAPGKLANLTVVAGDGGTRWEQWALPRALAILRPDVLFAPGYTAPLTAPCPTVVTIHDVSFAAHPEWFPAREGWRRRRLTAWSARRARVVLTDSAFSRDEITRYLGIPKGKVRVVSPGMTRHGSGEAGNGLQPASEGRLREPIVLFVGSIFRRRHVDRLIAAFTESVASRVPASRLEIVGENRSYPHIDLSAALRDCPAEVARRVSLRSYVEDAALSDIYERASVFAFPSEYEGFGLTPLEALAAGVPPVVLDTPIAHEICGEGARYVPTDLSSPIPLADAIVDLLTSPEARANVLRHANHVLARYDWTRTAQETLEALEEGAGV